MADRLDIADIADTAAATPQRLLRFYTCGPADDGKSSLLGRLLYEAQALPLDQLAAAAAASRRWGTQGEHTDCALLLDGLAAEREQGITIDVAWRYFSSPRRSYIVADYARLAAQLGLGLGHVTPLPLSALHGGNLVQPSTHLPGYGGPTLLQALDASELAEDGLAARSLRLPVQWINRPGADFRGVCGMLASGTLRAGDRAGTGGRPL